jgi:hypothetical protein
MLLLAVGLELASVEDVLFTPKSSSLLHAALLSQNHSHCRRVGGRFLHAGSLKAIPHLSSIHCPLGQRW